MKNYRYVLEVGSKKYNCPSCRGQKRFRLYIDNTTGQHISEDVGLCDRENSCGYHFSPKQYFADNPDRRDAKIWVRPDPETAINKPIEYLPIEYLEKSMICNESCSLFKYFKKLFRHDVAKQLCDKYFIGASKEGHTVFWQVDFKADIRQAKIMQYNSLTGRRNRETGALFAGKRILGNKDAYLQQCFFGEVQLSYDENKYKRVAIVESEKTAAVASVYFNDIIFLATGGKNGCKWTDYDVCKVLAGRQVLLYPDAGAYDAWAQRGKLLANTAGCKVVVSDLIESKASEQEKKEGLDIADYLLKQHDSSGMALTGNSYPVIWDLKNGKL